MEERGSETKLPALITNTPRELIVQEIRASLTERSENENSSLIDESFSKFNTSLIYLSSKSFNIDSRKIKGFQPPMLKELGMILLAKVKKILWLRRLCHSAVTVSVVVPIFTLVWVSGVPATTAISVVACALGIVGLIAYFFTALVSMMTFNSMPFGPLVNWIIGVDYEQVKNFKKLLKNYSLLKRFRTENEIYEELHKRLE